MSIIDRPVRRIKLNRVGRRPATPFGAGLEEGYVILLSSPVHGRLDRTAIITETPNFPKDGYRFAYRLFEEGREIESVGFDFVEDAKTYLRHATTPLHLLLNPVRRPVPAEPEVLNDIPPRKHAGPTASDQLWWSSCGIARTEQEGEWELKLLASCDLA